MNPEIMRVSWKARREKFQGFYLTRCLQLLPVSVLKGGGRGRK